MNKILYRDHQFLFIKNERKDYGEFFTPSAPSPCLDIPSNRKIFDDFIKDYAVEDKVREQQKQQKPNFLVRRRGSWTSISVPHSRSDDDSFFTDESVEDKPDELNDSDG